MLSIEGFESLVRDTNQALLGRAPATISYGEAADLAANAENNGTVIAQEIGQGANIYALWARENLAARWVVMYIGQRSQQFASQRINQHLFITPNGTQSKIEQVRALVQQGHAIGISTVLVTPDPIRLSVEDQIIYLNTNLETDLPWNNKSRNVALRRA